MNPLEPLMSDHPPTDNGQERYCTYGNCDDLDCPIHGAYLRDEGPTDCQILIAPFTVCGDPVEPNDDLCAHHRVRMLWDLCRALNEAGTAKAAQLTKLRDFAEFVVSLDDDDPESPGRIARKTVHLNMLIVQARAALAAERSL